MNGLQLEKVRKYYSGGEGETIRAVDGVTLAVPPGEFVALYGPSGSGKSTLLMVACGLLMPDSGTVLIDGISLCDLPETRRAEVRRHHIGVVFQSFQLMPGANALDNASVKLLADGYSLREARKRVLPWLERVGLGHRLNQPAAKLSMGERQRVAIARALAGNPRLIAADEPTGNLDSKRSAEVLGLLREICHDSSVGVLLVTHDPQAAHYADRLYTLLDGKLHEGLNRAVLELGQT